MHVGTMQPRCRTPLGAKRALQEAASRLCRTEEDSRPRYPGLQGGFPARHSCRPRDPQPEQEEGLCRASRAAGAAQRDPVSKHTPQDLQGQFRRQQSSRHGVHTPASTRPCSHGTWATKVPCWESLPEARPQTGGSLGRRWTPGSQAWWGKPRREVVPREAAQGPLGRCPWSVFRQEWQCQTSGKVCSEVRPQLPAGGEGSQQQPPAAPGLLWQDPQAVEVSSGRPAGTRRGGAASEALERGLAADGPVSASQPRAAPTATPGTDS